MRTDLHADLQDLLETQGRARREGVCVNPESCRVKVVLLQEQNTGCFPCHAFQQVPGRVVGLRLVMCSPEEKY